MSEVEQETTASRYEDLEVYRQPFLDRARDCSALTIPSLIPPLDFATNGELPQPYQSMGARGVNNLAAKLLLALLPPAASFFKLSLTEKFRQQLQQAELSAADLALSKMEQSVLREIEVRNYRANTFEAFKHLIVGGNVLIHQDDDGPLRFFPLSQYVTKRDKAGNILEIILKEVIDVDQLPDKVRERIEQRLKEEKPDDPETDVEVYTHIRHTDDEKKWEVCQEILGEEIEETRGTYPLDKNPWRPLRWSVVSGEDYGRGHCEEYYADLSSLDALEHNLLDAAAVCARGLWLVNPNSGINTQELVEQPNWGFVDGTQEDIIALQANKFADLKVVSDEINRLESRLQYAFLLHSAVQRDAERVTAEEIRFVASELENTLGGVYSVMSSEFQLPLVTMLLAQMQKGGKLPMLPKNSIEPIVVAGVDALGRSRQGMLLDQLLESAVQIFGPQALPYFSLSEWLSRKCASLGIDPTNLVKSDQDVQAAQAQAQQQQMMQKLGPSVIKGVADNVNQQQQVPQENEA